LFENLGRDVRYALRTLRREPMFVAGVLLTLALAIGMNAAMFGLITRLMVAAPPGIRDADRVAQVRLRVTEADGNSFAMSTTSYPVFRALQARRDAFAAAAATRPDTLMAGRSPDLQPLAVLGASGEFFATMGATPGLGRFFAASDDEPPSGNSVVVLAYAYWQRTFAGDAAVVGQELIIDDQPFKIVGVAQRGFNGAGLAGVDVFVPLPAALRNRGDWATNRYLNLVEIVVRLRDGVTPVRAGQIASASVRSETEATGNARNAVELVSVVPGSASRQSAQGRIAIWLGAVSIIVLVIATANVGTLLSLRLARRRREIAVRIALGASRRQLVQQFLVESVMLSTLGATVGLLLSRWFADVLRVTLLPTIAVAETFIDGRVLALSVAAAIVVGVVAALAPSTQIGGTNLGARLRSGGGHGSSGRLALQNTLVTAQVGLSMLLLVGAALFVRSLERVQSQDLGFSAAKLLFVTFEFRGYVAGVERDMAHEEAVERLRGLPGVSGATVVQGIPFGPHSIPPISIPGFATPPTLSGNPQIPIMYGATPTYLDIMGVTLVAGRSFTERDQPGTAPVVLVNESMARTVWPGQSALGRCIRIGRGAPSPTEDPDPAASQACREVVGVVRDSRARSLRPERSEDRLMQYYVPFGQLPAPPIPDLSHVEGLMVRVEGDIDRAAALVQRSIQSTSAVPLYARTRPYADLLDPQLRPWRLGATLFSAFGALALGIATVGLFGVVSYVTTQRTQEIGVRLALGGTRQRVARLIVTDALRMVSVGVLIGAAGALVAGQFVASMLFQTSPREPASIVIAAGVLLAATVLAAASPAWRAGRVSPMVALRAAG
jgi:predicted permease